MNGARINYLLVLLFKVACNAVPLLFFPFHLFWPCSMILIMMITLHNHRSIIPRYYRLSQNLLFAFLATFPSFSTLTSGTSNICRSQ
ncbi:hypothetical protein BDR22DRAFT_833452 [Usnea florida]